MPEHKELDRGLSPAADSSLRRHWTTPVIETFDISDMVKGAGGTESDSLGGTTPAAS